MAVTVKDLSIKTWWRSLVTFVISLVGATCDALHLPECRTIRSISLQNTVKSSVNKIATQEDRVVRPSNQTIGLGKSVE